MALAAIAATAIAPSGSVAGQGRSAPILVRTHELARGEAEFIAALRPFAACLVRARSPLLLRFIATSPAAHGARRLQQRLERENAACSPPRGRFRAEPLQLRGAIFETLIRNEFADVTPPATFASVRPIVYLMPYPQAEREARMISAGLMDVYDCAVRSRPADVRRLLDSGVHSPGEAEALSALAPAFAACFPAGQRWELQPHVARPPLAEAYYTLIKVHRQTQSEVGR